MAAIFPVTALVIAGLVYDTRLFYVAMMVVFVLYPALLLFAWYGLLSRPWTVASMFPQQVALYHDGTLTVTYRALPAKDKNVADHKGEDETKDAAEHEKDRNDRCGGASGYVPAELVIERRDVNECRVWNDYVVVTYKGNRELIIPLSAFSTTDEIRSFISLLAPDSSGRT